jgi:hypothetical protein
MQHDAHVRLWRVLFDHGRDKYRPGDKVKVSPA